MKRLLCLLPLAALAGCPPPPRYAVVEVLGPEPIEDALVATDCGHDAHHNWGNAVRTDDSGRVRVPVYGDMPADRCVVTVAKPGYPTVEADGVQLCSTPTACPPTIVQLFRAYGFPVAPQPPIYTPPRTYAQPPRVQVEVYP
jgi:hypothetical protein